MSEPSREAIKVALATKRYEVNFPAYGEARGDWVRLNDDQIADVILALRAAKPERERVIETTLTLDDLLILLAEECSEVTQAATKALRFGWDVDHEVGYGNNRMVLSREIGDLLAIIDALPLDLRCKMQSIRPRAYCSMRRALSVLPNQSQSAYRPTVICWPKSTRPRTPHAWVRDVLKQAHRAIRLNAPLAAVPPSPVAGEWQPIETAPRDRVIVARNANDDRFQVWWQDAAFKGFPIPGGIFCVPFLTEWSPAMSSTHSEGRK